jgi:hypothetical protein
MTAKVLLDPPSPKAQQIRKDSAVHASLSRLHLSKSRIAKRCTPHKTSATAQCPRPSQSLVSGSSGAQRLSASTAMNLI